MTASRPQLLPTSVVGSHGLPGWVWLAREAMEAGRLGALDLRELTEDATQVALLDQQRAGVDVLTTGEMGRVRFIIGFYDRIAGIRTLPPPRRLGQPLWDTNTPFQVTEKISAPQGLGIVEEFRLARSLTDQPLKATVPGPYTLLVPLRLGGAYRDKGTLLADLVAIVNAECRALVAAGADFIQIDEPHHGMYAGSVHNVTRGINQRWPASRRRSPCTSASATSTAARSARSAITATSSPWSAIWPHRKSSSSSPTAGSTSPRAGGTGPATWSSAPA
jgi:hypothetical protein